MKASQYFAAAVVLQCSLFGFLLVMFMPDNGWKNASQHFRCQTKNAPTVDDQELESLVQRIDSISVATYQGWIRRAKTSVQSVHITTSLLPDVCAPTETMQKFDEIYNKGVWNDSPMLAKEDFYSNAAWPPKQRKSASGGGSDLGPFTTTSMEVIRQTIAKYNVSTMIDLPCGDTNWIFDSWETDSLKLYIGLDVVKEVIVRNSERLSHHANKVFRHWDGTTCPLPKYRDESLETVQAVDLVHSRDVFQHLSQDQGLAFMCNVVTSGARVFIATSFPKKTNINIKAGGFTHINLHSAPYHLPPGDCVFTHPKHEPDQTCVYDLTQPWVQPWIAEKCSQPMEAR